MDLLELIRDRKRILELLDKRAVSHDATERENIEKEIHAAMRVPKLGRYTALAILREARAYVMQGNRGPWELGLKSVFLDGVSRATYARLTDLVLPVELLNLETL